MAREHREPRIEDLLADPLTHAVLRRDGLELHELRRFIETMRHRLRARFADLAA
ncbi:MAG TPA: hypothetical protein VEH84_08510 [Alphaproteobacteria bacterium]|nr:hypothetical protein [Alphaproteobacteria bacterium]